MNKYFVVIEERTEIRVVVEAQNSKEAYEKAVRGEYDIDEKDTSPLSPRVRRVWRI